MSKDTPVFGLRVGTYQGKITYVCIYAQNLFARLYKALTNIFELEISTDVVNDSIFHDVSGLAPSKAT